MRFNDLLRTVLANAGEGESATVTRWRQCIDLLAQYDVSGAEPANALEADDRDAVLRLIADIRPRIGLDQRIASINELGPRLRSPGLVRLLSQDHPSLVAAMMANVRLTDADWAEIIPHLGPLARSVLRRRTDLEPLAEATLRQFGSIDMALTSLVPLDEADGGALLPEEGVACVLQDNDDQGEEQSQIERIVAQIERFTEIRAHREEPTLDDAVIEPGLPGTEHVSVDEGTEAINDFTFEADTSGIIRVVSGAPRSAVVGLGVGMPSADSRHGADGTALGAFRRRAAFENARFTIGEGLLEGGWRISGEPRFDRATGRFLGYAGTARREYPHEGLVQAPSPAAGWAGLSAASTRQLIHELRTPLNAIHGYAEMIEAQLLGPVSSEYRAMAERILVDARTLMATFDDLDMASRIERGDHRSTSEQIDLTSMLQAIVASFDRSGAPCVDLFIDPMPLLIGGDRGQVERMLTHLLRAGRAALADGERLAVHLGTEMTSGAAVLRIRRPAALLDIADQDLFDHGYLVDQRLNDGPTLGLAFTLKLIRGIAGHLGGTFEIAPESFDLLLPAETATGSEQERQR